MLNSKMVGLGSVEPLWTHKVTGAEWCMLTVSWPDHVDKGRLACWSNCKILMQYSPLEIAKEIHVPTGVGLLEPTTPMACLKEGPWSAFRQARC